MARFALTLLAFSNLHVIHALLPKLICLLQLLLREPPYNIMVVRVVGTRLANLLGLQLHFNPPLLIGELEGIRDEVDQNLLIPLLIPVDPLEVF